MRCAVCKMYAIVDLDLWLCELGLATYEPALARRGCWYSMPIPHSLLWQ